ncbi:hemin ABC transporter substrate-binding protein [Endozoicomonas sp. OPT23]|uniref:heme/hemin ABC transporter substrate-binding protein n=1 Tax=Endozoicomonas sp. OPT23 TaxID=2072845 RepID=UPI00129B1BD7|nr:ABC transporter substrate-binding protein [Endozoicomonas sp. OPT23]MRI33088.1 hemin ABC transporter substrate-binding protein [Endozoicomonas sp. OPT23]
MKKLLLAVAACLPMTLMAAQKNDARIISAGNGITEIIYTLGAGEQVIAVDSTSNFPDEVNKLPKLGYHKALSAEGILALQPDLLVGTNDMGPDTTITQLEMAGLDIASYPVKDSAENIKERITALADLLGREEQGKALWSSISADLNKAKEIASDKKKPKVIFLLAMGNRSPSISGGETGANALINMAGGVNPAEKQFTSYKPLSTEALLAMSPDVILFSDRGRGTTVDQLLDIQPALKQTPAGKNRRVINLDGRLLLGGLGPRTGETVLRLARAFYKTEH